MLYHSDKLYYIRLYNLESESMNEYQLTGRHIKCHQVSQNIFGRVFLIPYLDDGTFKLMVFDNDQVLCDLHINDLLGIDNSTVSINGVHDPIINACFINDENIFVNLFHKTT